MCHLVLPSIDHSCLASVWEQLEHIKQNCLQISQVTQRLLTKLSSLFCLGVAICMQTHDAKDRAARWGVCLTTHQCVASVWYKPVGLCAWLADFCCVRACQMVSVQMKPARCWVCRNKQPTWSCGSCCKLATVNAHRGAALCNVELTDGRVAWGPLLDPPGTGVGSLAMQPSPTSQPISTWLFGRLSIVVGVDTGPKPVSCKHASSVKQQLIDQMSEVAWFMFC